MSTLDDLRGAERHENGIGRDGKADQLAIQLADHIDNLSPVLRGERVSNPVPDYPTSALHPDPSYQHIQRMTSIVPQELAEMIIDYLYNDKRALGRCGLVCRSWLPSSRFHLFSTILLHERNIDTALTVLCSPDSTIPPYVRRVKIGGGEEEGRWMNKWLRRLPPLSSVDSLSLFYIHWDSQMFGVMEKLFPFFRNIKTLQLDSVTFETLHNALEFFSSASSLEYLHLGYLDSFNLVLEEIDEASVTQFPVPSLKEISFKKSFGLPQLLDWLSLGQTSASVNSVSYDVEYIPVIRSMTVFFKALGLDLEHLTLNFMSCRPEYRKEYLEGMDITHNRSLRTISFESIGCFFDWAIKLLSQITSCVIESVTLHILPHHAKNIPALAALFTGRNAVFVGRSTRLRFKIFDDINNECQTVIREHLYELDVQGRLELFKSCAIFDSPH